MQCLLVLYDISIRPDAKELTVSDRWILTILLCLPKAVLLPSYITFLLGILPNAFSQKRHFQCSLRIFCYKLNQWEVKVCFLVLSSRQFQISSSHNFKTYPGTFLWTPGMPIFATSLVIWLPNLTAAIHDNLFIDALISFLELLTVLLSPVGNPCCRKGICIADIPLSCRYFWVVRQLPPTRHPSLQSQLTLP